MTFQEFLATQSVTDDPAGDFIGDVRRDLRFPVITSWPQLKYYLWSRTHDDRVLRAAQVVWRRFQRATK